MIEFYLAIKTIVYNKRLASSDYRKMNLGNILNPTNNCMSCHHYNDYGISFSGLASAEQLYSCSKYMQTFYDESDYYFCAPFGIDNFEFGTWYDNPFGFRQYYIECTCTSIIDDYLMDNEYINDYLNHL